jgi:hypothetical protein
MTWQQSERKQRFGQVEMRSRMNLFLELTGNVAKVLSPSAVYFAAINITTVKDLVLIAGAIVTMVCTILVTASTIKKNKRG